MAKKKYYAVRLGKRPGIYENWDACKEQIDGFKGAVYKKLPDKKEAEGFLHGRDTAKTEILGQVTGECPVVFTDGSFDQTCRRYGYGVVILEEAPGGIRQVEICGSGNNPAFLESRNIPGEILGVLKALEWVLSQGYKKVRLFYDYAGLEKWATGAWKANKPVSEAYVREYTRRFAGKIQVFFEKVKGHSNNIYNDRADALAKRGVETGASEISEKILS